MVDGDIGRREGLAGLRGYGSCTQKGEIHKPWLQLGGRGCRLSSVNESTPRTAAIYPLVGAVIICREHRDGGPLGWSGNRHNPATGWYWLRTTTIHEPNDRSETFKHRKHAEADAVKRFTNIVGWETSRTSCYAVTA